MPSLQEALDSFLKVDRSKITNRNYASLLERMVAAVGPARNLKRITLLDLQDFVNPLKPDLSAASFHQYVVVIKAFFNWCCVQKWIKVSPAGSLIARRPSPDPTEIKAIPTELLNAMIDRCRYEPRNYALLLFLADTGARRGGAATLCLSRLYLDERRAVVMEKGQKMCWVYFGELTAAALAAWIAVRPKVDHDYVFTGNRKGSQLKPDSITSFVERLAKKCGDGPWGPHSLRHWQAESMVMAGAMPNDVQHKLNQAHVETTMRYYFPAHNRNVESMSSSVSLNRLTISQPATVQPSPGKIIRLDDAG